MPLFPHHDADPTMIRTHATDALGTGDAYTVLSGQLSGRARTAGAEVDGYIEAPVKNVTKPQDESSQRLSQTSYLASGALNRYAAAVDAYNSGIDRLNERYEQAKAADFHVGAPVCTVDGVVESNPPEDRDAAVREADSALKATLRSERDQLLTELDSEATAIGKILDTGPSDQSIMLLIAAGYLPQSVVSAFPNIDLATLDTIRAYFHEARKLWKTPGKFRKLFAMFSAAGDLKEVAAELARTEKQWGAILSAIGRNLDTTTLASLNTYMKSREEISLLQYTKLFAQADHAKAVSSWVDAAKATGKIGGPLAVLSVVSNTADLADLIANGNGNKGALDTTLRATGNITGLVSSGGGLLALTPALSLGPVGAGVLIGAGLVSAGIMIYRNWDQITEGVSNAINWTGDRLHDVGEWTGDRLHDLGEWGGDRLNDVKEWGSGVVDDVGETLGNAWDAVTPW